MAEKETLKIGQGKAGPGRPKGLQNKTTKLLKDAILQAAQEAGGKDGTVGYLRVQAIENPGPFMALLGKVLPQQVAADVTMNVIATKPLTAEQWAEQHASTPDDH